jgi:hypothetical protein
MAAQVLVLVSGIADTALPEWEVESLNGKLMTLRFRRGREWVKASRHSSNNLVRFE